MKSTKPRRVFDTKEGKFCVLEIDTKKQVVVYNLRGSQSKFLSKITLEGFTALPSGLFLGRNGWGFSSGSKGYYLLEGLHQYTNQHKPIDLIVSLKRHKAFLKELALKTKIVISFNDARRLLAELGKLNREHNVELRESVASFLSTVLPMRIKVSPEKFGMYHPGELSELLGKSDIGEKLNEDDLKAFSAFFQKTFSAKIQGRKSLIKEYKIKFAKAGRKITERVYLEEVIVEFEERLKKKTRDEEGWQKFLKAKVFPFLTGYVDIVDKENIGVDENYPDFVLIDVYGFADIFEIKTHITPLLTYDPAHRNYFWKSEVSETISQLENYLDTLILNQAEFIKKLRRYRQLPVKVVKPRGYIVAGMSSEFRGRDREKMEEDFRRLGKSLKNIDFILYDELLANLKNIKSKLEK